MKLLLAVIVGQPVVSENYGLKRQSHIDSYFCVVKLRKLPLCQSVFCLKLRMDESPYWINLEKYTVNIDKI